MRSSRGLPPYASRFVPPLVLGLLPFVLFAPITLLRRVFWAHDVLGYFFPYHVLPARLLAEGHLPLWNPYVFSGMQLLGDGQTAMLYPPNWLFFLLPSAAALSYALLLQFSIAGIGTYLFARSLGLWRLPAFISGVAYMFCGFLTARVVHMSIMSGAALIPLILFCLDRLLALQGRAGARRDLQFRWFSATVLALACQAFAGHPQIPVYTGLAVGFYTIVRGLERSVGARAWRPLATGLMLLTGASLLGYALAAIQLLPWIEAARLSVRAAGPDFAFVFGTSTSGAEWLLFLFPYLLGAHSTSVFAAGSIGIQEAVRAWEHSSYVGILPLALAGVALWHFAELTGFLTTKAAPGARAADAAMLRRRWYSMLFLVLLLVAGVTLAAGSYTPVSQLVYRIPALGSLRAVERGAVLASFSLTLMAGLGLQRIIERPQRRVWLLIPAAAIVAVPALFVWQPHTAEAQPLFGMAAQDLRHLSIERPNAYVPVLWALASGSLLAWWSCRPSGSLTQVVAAALVLGDLGLYAISFNPTANRRLYEYRPQSVQAMRRDGDLFRKATVVVETNELPVRTAQETLALSWGMVHDVEDVNGFNSLQPRRYTDYLFGPDAHDVSYGYLRDPALFRSDSAILSSLNVRYVLVPSGVRMDLGSHLRAVYENANVRVYENTHVYPRAYFSDSVRVVLDPRAVLQQVTEAGFDGRREALVESEAAPSLQRPTSPATCTATRDSPNELSVTTVTAEPRFLVVSEMYAPGWRAYVDGVETPVYRTNYLFRGVVVPAGQHLVQFVYRPISIAVGAAVSSVAVLILSVLMAHAWSRGGRADPPLVSGCSSSGEDITPAVVAEIQRDRR
ncbi:MAG: YfhO family protein [Acidobacteria bacterium]|nr:YfhO family protein [Acidobacteriota bacterium]